MSQRIRKGGLAMKTRNKICFVAALVCLFLYPRFSADAAQNIIRGSTHNVCYLCPSSYDIVSYIEDYFKDGCDTWFYRTTGACEMGKVCKDHNPGWWACPWPNGWGPGCYTWQDPDWTLTSNITCGRRETLECSTTMRTVCNAGCYVSGITCPPCPTDTRGTVNSNASNTTGINACILTCNQGTCGAGNCQDAMGCYRFSGTNMVTNTQCRGA